MIKQAVSHMLLRAMLPRFDSSDCGIDRVLGQAVRLQCRSIDDEHMRQAMELFYNESQAEGLKAAIGFDEIRVSLDRPNGYKVPILGLAREGSSLGVFSRINPWRRRFGLLRHLRIGLDVLVLRRGQQVPPHGHHRVVSGFYLLEGKVACQHFDRVREEESGLVVRKALDLIHEPGGYTTNSEWHHNIHWLHGIAEASYLFRTTITNTHVQTFGNVRTSNERVYVDPTGAPDEGGLIRAPFITETEAKVLQMRVADERLTAARS